MTDKTFYRELSRIPGSRINQIILAVTHRLPPEQAGLRTQVEQIFYQRLWAEAENHAKKHGFWPVFELCEIESDDPVLDIYSTPPERT